MSNIKPRSHSCNGVFASCASLSSTIWLFGYLAIERFSICCCQILVFAFSQERPTWQSWEYSERGRDCEIRFPSVKWPGMRPWLWLRNPEWSTGHCAVWLTAVYQTHLIQHTLYSALCTIRTLHCVWYALCAVYNAHCTLCIIRTVHMSCGQLHSVYQYKVIHIWYSSLWCNLKPHAIPHFVIETTWKQIIL